MSEARLRAFAEAFNRHDPEAVFSMFTDDCVFDMPAGPEPWGTRRVGEEALREAFPWAWRAWPDARWEKPTHVAAGDRGFSEWTFRGTGAGGRATEVRGVDLFVSAAG